MSPAATYVRENWTVADGLPINTITSIVQTRDGYLWLGTNDGVVRFDGVRSPSTTPASRSPGSTDVINHKRELVRSIGRPRYRDRKLPTAFGG